MLAGRKWKSIEFDEDTVFYDSVSVKRQKIKKVSFWEAKILQHIYIGPKALPSGELTPPKEDDVPALRHKFFYVDALIHGMTVLKGISPVEMTNNQMVTRAFETVKKLGFIQYK
jgi:hypothetical protein